MTLAVGFSGLALACYVALMFITIRMNSRSKTNQAFALYLLAMAFWQFTALMVSVSKDAATAIFWYRLMTPGLGGQFIFYLFFTLAFLGVEKRRGFLYAGWLVFIALLATSGTDLLVDSVSEGEVTGLLVPHLGPVVLMVGLIAYIILGYAVYRFIRGYRAAKSDLQRNRIKYLLAGAGAIAFGTASNVVPDLQAYPIDVAAGVLNAIFIAYAILRYHLLDITIVVRKGLLYSVPTAVIGVGYFLIVYTGVRIFHFVTDYQVFLLSLVVAGMTALVSEPLRNRVQSWVDKVFFREKYDSGLMLRRLSGAAVSILDLDRLTGLILGEVAATMHIESAAFFLREEKSGEFRLSTQMGLDPTAKHMLSSDHPIVEWLSGHSSLLTHRDIEVMPEFKALWGQERDDLERIGADLFVPLKAKGERMVGIFAVGRKLSEQPYSQDDRLTLITLGNQTAMAIENARLYEASQQELAERKRAEEQIKASLREKELLLKEIHHRVKNNLQVISSLLYLQSKNVSDEQTFQMFRESQSRVRSMALVHESLYQSKDLARIDFAEYIRNLAAYIFRSYGADSKTVNLEVDAEGVFLGIDVAVPWALITNELISNSLKHAFPNGRGGEIRVRLRTEDDRGLVLTVCDDGVGFPDGLDFRDTKSLGLQLVNTLVDQLEGTIEIDGSEGTEFTITIPQS